MNLVRPAVQLFEKLRERYRIRKHLRKLLRHTKGYEFAMDEYFKGHATIAELENWTDTSRTFNSYDGFDDGVEAAIRKLNSMELPNAYQPSK